MKSIFHVIKKNNNKKIYEQKALYEGVCGQLNINWGDQKKDNPIKGRPYLFNLCYLMRKS